MTAPQIPEALTEAAARAIYNRWRLSGGTPWEQMEPPTRQYWLAWGKEALAAAFETGDVQQEWRTMLRYDSNHHQATAIPYSTKDAAIRHAEMAHDKSVILRDGSYAATVAWAETRLCVKFYDGSQWTSAWQEVAEDGATEQV